MFTRRRKHKVPMAPRRDAFTILLDRANADLAAHGQVKCPAAPWITAASVLLTIRHGCGWDMSTRPLQIIEPFFQQYGWTWRWVDEDLVLELPGWTQPAPAIVAIQPSLFDTIPPE